MTNKRAEQYRLRWYYLPLENRALKNGSWVECYGFCSDENGAYSFRFQCGWYAGSHNDGAGFTKELNKEWFRESWDMFLDNFLEKYPEDEYGCGKEELAKDEELKRFLGF